MVEAYGTHVHFSVFPQAWYEGKNSCRPQGSIEILAWLAEQWSNTGTDALYKNSSKLNGQVQPVTIMLVPFTTK